jgi:hypothetical protein
LVQSTSQEEVEEVEGEDVGIFNSSKKFH